MRTKSNCAIVQFDLGLPSQTHSNSFDIVTYDKTEHDFWWDSEGMKYYMDQHMIHLMTKPTKWHVRAAKTQISLDIRPF